MASAAAKAANAANAAPGDSAHLDHAWSVLDAYFRDTPYFLTRHHLDSYDRFVEHDLAVFVRGMNPFKLVKDGKDGARYDVTVNIGRERIWIDRPTVVDPDGSVRPLFPNEARLKDLTYGANLYADVEVEYSDGEKPIGLPVRFESVHIGRVPVMLHSRACLLREMPMDALREMGECVYDQGGYFIVDGKEKVIVTRETQIANKMYVTELPPGMQGLNRDHSHRTIMVCTSPKDVFPRRFAMRVRRLDGKKRSGAIEFSVRGLDEHWAPLFVLFRALGVESDRAIMEHVTYDVDAPESAKMLEFLRPSAIDAAFRGIFTQQAAVDALAPATKYKSAGDVKQVLVDDLFPHMGTDFAPKALYLGHLVRHLAEVCMGSANPADRDDYRNKRLMLSGFLLGDEFRDKYRILRDQFKRRMDREFHYGPWRATGDIRAMITPANLPSMLPAAIVTDGLMQSMKGDWGAAGEDAAGEDDREVDGVVQDLTRTSYMTYVAHVRRVNNPFPRSRKDPAPHRLLASHWGVLCPVESPDGPNIGLLNHLAVLAHVTNASDAQAVHQAMGESGHIVPLAAAVSPELGGLRGLLHAIRIMLNGAWTGVTFDPAAFVKSMKGMKLAGKLPVDVSVTWDVIGGEVRVNTDRGRCCRPLIRVAGREPALRTWLDAARKRGGTLAWKDLIWANDAPMELVDTDELSTALVAMAPDDIVRNPALRYTHCELHPAASALGVIANTFPMFNRNAGQYNVLSIAQFKQAVGVYATNFASRMDVMASVLHHPQRPLVSTRFADKMCAGQMAHGENLVVAVMSYTGYNQEDALILNLDSVQRGRLALSYYKTKVFTDQVAQDGSTYMANPLRMEELGHTVSGVAFARYDKIGEDGAPIKDAFLAEDDVIMGAVESRHTTQQQQQQQQHGGSVAVEYRDRSETAGRAHAGFYVDRVFTYRVGKNSDKRCKVRLRQLREPELGDKLATRFGQKGVIGMLIPQRDMPFSHRDGIVPDLIINPNSFPKRMTVAHLLECLLGKTCAMGGTRCNVNVFEPGDVAGTAAATLRGMGMYPYGDEVFYNGRTGEQIHADVFVGLNYYGRLKHMVADKLNFRSGAGPINAIVRQPAKGAGHHGGLRIGEMEQNAILAHGVAGFLKESFMERSDRYRMVVDADAGGIAASAANAASELYRSADAPSSRRNVDCSPPEFVNVEVPYAFKLLQQELQGMSIDARLDVMETADAAAATDAGDDAQHDATDAPWLPNDDSDSEGSQGSGAANSGSDDDGDYDNDDDNDES